MFFNTRGLGSKEFAVSCLFVLWDVFYESIPLFLEKKTVTWAEIRYEIEYLGLNAWKWPLSYMCLRVNCFFFFEKKNKKKNINYNNNFIL